MDSKPSDWGSYANFPNSESQSREFNEAARTIGVQFHIVNVGKDSDFDVAFGTLSQIRSGGLVVAADPFFNSRRAQIVALAETPCNTGDV
jgi:putative tryptophan/tyrosine transport system substrate-binding protein